MSVRIHECPECGGKLKVVTGQSIHFDQLWWFRSFRCEQCTFATEEDGCEQDDELRNEILQTEGESILLIHNPDDHTSALVVTRQALGFEMSNVIQFRRIDPTCVATGTKVEMEWLRQCLEKKSIEAQVTINSSITKHAPDVEPYD